MIEDQNWNGEPFTGKIQFMGGPQSIVFTLDGKEVLRITKDAVIGNPDVPADKAAVAILKALEQQIRALK